MAKTTINKTARPVMPAADSPRRTSKKPSQKKAALKEKRKQAWLAPLLELAEMAEDIGPPDLSENFRRYLYGDLRKDGRG